MEKEHIHPQEFDDSTYERDFGLNNATGLEYWTCKMCGVRAFWTEFHSGNVKVNHKE